MTGSHFGIDCSQGIQRCMRSCGEMDPDYATLIRIYQKLSFRLVGEIGSCLASSTADFSADEAGFEMTGSHCIQRCKKQSNTIANHVDARDGVAFVLKLHCVSRRSGHALASTPPQFQHSSNSPGLVSPQAKQCLIVVCAGRRS